MWRWPGRLSRGHTFHWHEFYRGSASSSIDVRGDGFIKGKPDISKGL